MLCLTVLYVVIQPVDPVERICSHFAAISRADKAGSRSLSLSVNPIGIRHGKLTITHVKNRQFKCLNRFESSPFLIVF